MWHPVPQQTVFCTDVPTSAPALPQVGGPQDPSLSQVAILSVPDFDGQASLFSQGFAEPRNQVCGAVQSVLPHPTNPDICFAGGANSGVWRTMNCMDAQPTWMPLTDDQDSLSVADIVFDKSDTSYNTIYVAIGRRSSFGRAGGIGIGLLKTTNALAQTPTWEVIDNGGLFRE